MDRCSKPSIIMNITMYRLVSVPHRIAVEYRRECIDVFWASKEKKPGNLQRWASTAWIFTHTYCVNAIADITSTIFSHVYYAHKYFEWIVTQINRIRSNFCCFLLSVACPHGHGRVRTQLTVLRSRTDTDTILKILVIEYYSRSTRPPLAICMHRIAIRKLVDQTG